MSSQTIAVKARRIITPLQDLRDAVVLVEGGRIAAVGRQDHVAVPDGAKVIDVGDKIVAPGFIDMHHHGAVGVDATEGAEAVQKIGRHLVKSGTTAWLPTLYPESGVDLLQSIRETVALKERGTGGADVLGIHLEGPFLTPKRVPGHEDMDIGLQKPSVAGLQELVEAAQGNLKVMGISPELDGALEVIREMRRLGVVPAVAHTKGTYEDFLAAVEVGVRHVTHTYNVMTGFHHRKPGVVGGVLTCDQVTAELISDGYHVSPVAMDILVRCKGVDKVAVITDNVLLAGLPDGEYEMSGLKVIKEKGISRVAGSTPDQDNTMAGSEWPIDHNLHTLVDSVGLTLRDAVRMATLTPATIIGVSDQKGSIEPGKDADLVVIDENVHVYLTMVRGEVVFESGLTTA